MRTFVRGFFRRIAARRIARDLDGLHVRGLDRARGALRGGPVVFAATHVAWWDALVLLALDEALGCDGRALMDAANLHRLPFFRWIGALPIDRGSGARARHGLRAAAAFLDGPLRAVWIFPQGRQRPAHVRPLGLEPGVRVVVGAGDAVVVPVALTYGFREGERPAAVVAFGEPIPATAFSLPGLEEALVGLLGEADRFLDGQPVPFLPLVPPAGARTEASLATRVLAWAAGATAARRSTP